MEVKAPKGTMDILPPDSEHWRQVQEIGTRLFRLFGYHEIILPIMEYTEVFARSIGEGTDIVQKEMFSFKDKGGRSLTLRPEATASVARAFVEHHLEAAGMPQKLYYQGPMFRHERPQAGRYRQFRQLGVELIGSHQPSADTEVILLCREFFATLGVETELVINSVGDEACRPAYIEALGNYLREHADRLCEDCRRREAQNPLRVLDCKNEECAAVIEGSPDLETFLCPQCRDHFAAVESLLQVVDINYRRETRLVRGLDYYTRTVFEFIHPNLSAQNALSAGGRYDRLIEELGGKPTPAVGFSIGLERVMMAQPCLEEEGEEGVYVLAISEAARQRAFVVAQRLREAGIVTDLDHLERSTKAQMREADREGIPLCLIIGEDEIQGDFYTLRDMRNGAQERVPQVDLEDTIKRHMAGRSD